MNVASMDLQARLEVVFRKAAALLPADVGRRLLALISPAALTTMAAVVAIWAGSHFFGVGEIADVILLVVGWAAIGGGAIDAGKKLFAFALKTANARMEKDLDLAAQDLVAAIGILGVDVALALLMRRKPGDTFKTDLNPAKPMPPYLKAFPQALPRNGRWSYKATLTFTKAKFAGEGGTDALGNIKIGRDYVPGERTVAAAMRDVRRAVHHEQVHSFLAAKLYLLREPRIYMKMSAYKRSYILRYVEEAVAEVRSRAMTDGLGRGQLIEAIRFPLGNRYQLTVALLGHEAKGVLLGPAVVGGLTYNVYYGLEQ